MSVVDRVDGFKLEDQLHLLIFENTNNVAGDVADQNINSHLTRRSYRAATKGGGAELEHITIIGGHDGQARDNFFVVNHVEIKSTRQKMNECG